MLLKFAIQDYLEDRELRNVSKKTLEVYKGTLDEFKNYCIENEIVNVTGITQNTVKQYLRRCKNCQNNKPASLNHKLHNLKIFFNYLEDLQVVEVNPVKRIQYVKEEIKIEIFTDYQIKQMLNYYRRLKQRDKGFYAYRDYTMIVVLLGTGIRLGELINLRWNDIDLQNCSITVFGKKRQYSSIPLVDKLKKELCEYQVYCQQFFKTLPECVFTNTKGRQLTDNAIKCLFKRLKEVMAFNNVRLSCHTFRHTFAVNMIRNGADSFTLQKMLRHSSIVQTQRYVNLFGTALRDQNEKYNPLNNLEI